MKKIICLFLFAIFTLVANANGNKNKSAEPDAYVNKICADHNVTVNGRYGMRLHVALTIKEMKDKEVDLWFYAMYNSEDPDDYIRHIGVKNNYHTDSGYLSVRTVLTPGFNHSIFDDVTVFFPYDEFRLAPGTHELMIDIVAVYPTGENLAWLDYYEFELTEPDNSRSSATPLRPASKKNPLLTTGPHATFDSMWVDFDVTVDGKFGMRLHYKFTAYNLKDSTAYLMAFFLGADGRTGNLRDKNGQFTSTSGSIATWAQIKPGYPETLYNDLSMFIPYSELELKEGKYTLLVESKLIFANGGWIANFPFFTFNFTQGK